MCPQEISFASDSRSRRHRASEGLSVIPGVTCGGPSTPLLHLYEAIGGETLLLGEISETLLSEELY